MQVFAEFVRSDLTEDQVLPVLRRLLPTLLTILGAHDVSELTSPMFCAYQRHLLIHRGIHH